MSAMNVFLVEHKDLVPVVGSHHDKTTFTGTIIDPDNNYHRNNDCNV